MLKISEAKLCDSLKFVFDIGSISNDYFDSLFYFAEAGVL